MKPNKPLNGGVLINLPNKKNSVNRRNLKKRMITYPNNKTRFQKWKERAEKEVEIKIKREGKKLLIFKFFIGPILFFAGFGILFFLLPLTTFGIVAGLMVAYFFPPLGKESVIPMGIAAGINPILISSAIAYVDIIVALFLLWNYDFAKLAPLLGPWMERFERRAMDISKGRLWVKGLSFIGIVLFVMFPFQGTGAVGATVLGRLIGMKHHVLFIGICIGAITGCFLIAYSADAIKNILLENLPLGIIILIIIGVCIGVYVYPCRKKKRKTAWFLEQITEKLFRCF